MKSIKGKILTGFAIVLLILVAMASYSFITINSITDDVENITSNDMAFLESANSMTFSVANRAKIARDYILFNRSDSKTQFLAETEKAIETEKILEEAVTSGRISDQIKASLQDADEKTTKWRKLVTEEIIPLYDSGRKEEAIRLMEEKCLAYSQGAIDAWIKVVELQNNITKKQATEVQTEAKQSETFIIISSVLAIILAIVVAVYNAGNISRGIAIVVKGLEAIAKGDLQGKMIEVKSKDEIGRLILALNTMVANLKSLLERVSETSNQVAASSEQFMVSAEQSASSAEQVTTSIQNIAFGAETSSQSANESAQEMREMSIGMERIADFSKVAAKESHTTTKQAEEGNTLVQKAVFQMQSIQTSVGATSTLVSELGERSKEIGQILGVITGIAEQTNLLALNAAIEAARAGEHGRGFAVVADEVRKLAEESRRSADQIAVLINHIRKETESAVQSMDQGTKEVEVGTSVITEAGQAFGRILQSIQLVSEKMNEVSTFSVQASTSAQQVNKTVKSLAEIAQNTSVNSQSVAGASEEQLASMQEVTSSASTLRELAGELQNELNKFRF
ncbi:methyl-accepting chemotaxis protein [Bacillus sp. 31A1R]|uniref:Methyl-accepting chemotaxis protein n=1 Tax=Robertmurraya mangrovi TaxID=3098077 RepID=A0ABU5IW28_9BACI|nr:methyl-accepting chemotaxis protein [Bacillus sp. 31A1R]MDZ5471362.1 methyl-accepting chemotaxis protein [Bacillus sp. 31A1R]